MGAPATVGKYNNVSVANAWIAFRDDDGYAMGTLTAPNSPVNNTVYGAYVLSTIATLQIPEDVIPLVEFIGSGQRFASTFAGTTNFGNPTFELTGEDEQLTAYLNRSSVDTSTNTAATISMPNPGNKIFPSLLFGANIVVHNHETAKDEYITYIWTNCKIKKNGAAGAGQVTGDATNPNNLTFTVTPSLSTRGATGELYTGYATAITGGKTHYEVWRTSNPLYLATYVANGSATTFTLPYLPTSTDATGAGANAISVNGTPSSVTSVVATTGVVTLSAAGTAADIVQALVQTDYVVSP